MRDLFIVVAVCALGVGCAAPRVCTQPQVSSEVERWRQRYQEERARAEALAVRLAEVEGALAAEAQARAESERLSRQLEEELARVVAERQSLAEHNAQLMSRQRELTARQEELEDVWYQSALSRARRRSQPRSPPSSSSPIPAGRP
jgi:predicted nuclease with TOPRIM domain